MGAMQEVSPFDSATVSNLPPLFYYRPVNDKGGPCHTDDCDGRAACML